MSKVRIYIEPQKLNNLIEIQEKEVIRKLKDVLRLEKNEKVYVFNGKGEEFLYIIEDIRKGYILIKKQRVERKEVPPLKKLFLGFALLKEDKVDFILQKATELGAYALWPFICEHSIHNKPSLSKIQRWHKIVIEAARQSNRVWLPHIMEISDFSEVVRSKYECKVVASIEGGDSKNIIDKKRKEVLIIVGPEGDFSSREYTRLKENNFNFIRLSSNVLRTETAAVFAVGLINYFLYKNSNNDEG